MTPSSEAAGVKLDAAFGPDGDWDADAHVRFLRGQAGAASGYTADLIERLYRAYMSALTVTSFPPAEQHDVTSHAVPSDGEGAVAWRWKEAETDPAWEFAPFRPMAPGLLVQPLFTHPAPVAAQPAEGWVTCETCQGNGEIVTDWERYRTPHEGDKGDEAVTECPDCNGTGHVTPPTAPAVPAGLTEIIDGLREDYKTVREWSGSALVANELSKRDTREGLTQLYSDLCRLGNALEYYADALSALQRSSERQKALEEALKLSRETLMMVRDCFGRDMTQPFRERVDDSINAGSAALGYVAKPLATNPEPKS